MKYLLVTTLLLISYLKGEAQIRNYESSYFPNAQASVQIKKKRAIFRIRYNYFTERSYIRLNMYIEEKKDTVYFHFADYRFEAEWRSAKGIAYWTEDYVQEERWEIFPQLIYNPYVKYLKTGNKLTLLYVSNDMREFLVGNEIFSDSYKSRVKRLGERYYYDLYHANSSSRIYWLGNFKDKELFPPELVIVKTFSEDILPTLQKNKNEGKTGFKEFHKYFGKPIIDYDKNESFRDEGGYPLYY